MRHASRARAREATDSNTRECAHELKIDTMLDFDGILVPRTMGTLMLWELYTNPYRPIPIADRLGLSRNGAITKLHRAADSIGAISPRLAVALRFHVKWERGVATYKPTC
ncbi:hypothetical protein B0G81_6240 [Paraburkholderia sp. BL6665CI2N2]|uniref:hypothetical protein n=1 Tax=Paraburkholderia sp. BL6665CI2N2 TaxID=1938806 RepID=UPI0010659250|nr:hypothetical protein [Paraburkholderia sp. BL6665CI2N2]TDY25757.1 hypothetical protein B0G81_6240 [Paraburkholderia sp. BL6665CI2N2]